jgi:hypothetical protein
MKYLREFWLVLTPRGRIVCLLCPPLALLLWPSIHAEIKNRRMLREVLGCDGD